MDIAQRVIRRSMGTARAGHVRTVAATLCLLALTLVAGAATAAKVTSSDFPGVTCEVVQVPMRDGIHLTTYVYLPDGDGPYPVVLQRNPYGRLSGDDCFKGFGVSMAVYAEQGYAGVHQEVRGTYTSEGVYNPVEQEATDGYDAIEWAARQPWSTGKVGMDGSSYLAIVQWQAAALRPPHLAAIAPNIMGSDYHDNNVYVNGVPNLWLMQSWPAGTIVPDQIIRDESSRGVPPAQIAQDVADWNTLVNERMLSTWVWQLPLTGFTQFQQYAPVYYEWLDHPSYDDYWARVDTSRRYHDVEVPALVSGDWYDPFQVGTVENYDGMRTRGGSAEARRGTRLIMGAYGHSGNSGTPSFGDDTPDPSIKMRFFEHYLKGVDNGYENDPRVHLYVLVPPNSGNEGSGFWVTGSSYPLPGTRTVRYYLASGGHANSRFGDGELFAAGAMRHGHGGYFEVKSDRGRHAGFDRGWGNAGWNRPGRDGRSSSAPMDHFVYDPNDPVPTTGGNMCCNGALLPAGARDQNTVEMRDDVLVYTSDPLDHDMAVIGRVRAEFWAASSARDTDFTVKLVDVHPDGLTHNVLDRIVRARYRHGSAKPPQLIRPHNKPYRYTLELGNTATIFRPGHQVRVEISSSNFPHFARNLNTGLNNNDTSQVRVAYQTILHNGGHPSFVSLPVAPGISAADSRQ